MTPEEQELIEKLQAHLHTEFGATDDAAMKRLFDRHDTDHNGRIDKQELEQLLKAAGVGNAFTRGTWAKRILEKLDTNHDKAISWTEFRAAVPRHGG